MQTVFVSSSADSGAGSLRQTIIDAPANSDILFDPATFNVARTITLGSGQLDVGKNLNLIGPGASLLSVAGNNLSRVFNISGADVSLSGMTIANGNAGDEGGGGIRSTNANLALSESAIVGNTGNQGGGGVFVDAGTAAINSCTFTGNATTGGGAGLLINASRGTLSNSTLSGNNAVFAAGGVYVLAGGVLAIANTTIAGNTANAGSGAGIYVTSDTSVVTVRSSIIAGNTPPNLRREPTAPGAVLSSRGFNLSDDPSNVVLNQATDKFNIEALLGPLANNGGPTQTRILFPNSPAIDAGIRSSGARDQRNLIRGVDLAPANAAGGDGADIGAVELQTLLEGDPVFRNGFETAPQ